MPKMPAAHGTNLASWMNERKELKAKRIVDLSHTVIPGEEEYRLEVDTRFTDAWPAFAQYRRMDDAWYLISEVTMNTHVGTHVELPYHHCRDGQDASTFPVAKLVEETVWHEVAHYFGMDEGRVRAAERRRAGRKH